ncbi:MAG: GT4 family glycosyltransferase PelF, partial [Eubacteriaceae bacterium]
NMKICIIVEGCYPYIMGGVSSWVQELTTNTPEAEFYIQALIVDREQSGKFLYDLPDNVVEVREIYLQDMDWLGKKNNRKVRLSNEEKRVLRSLVFSENVQWGALFELFNKKTISVNALLMGEDFFEIIREYYKTVYNRIVFTDFLWTMRSVFMPMFLVLKNKPVKADLYHSVATGYSGLWGSMAKYIHNAPLLISEHGIYTREREEEIIKADWVKGIYKDVWIQQFGKLSQCAYEHADKVISLFESARKLQIEIGCPEEKTQVIPNGINAKRFENIVKEDKNDLYIDVGAVLRVTPVKDVKTMIHAFYYAKQKEPRLRLWIMGPLDEQKEYANECIEIVKSLGLKDVEFTGLVNVGDYLGKMDISILTSISEGQPLSILEAFAAKVPCVATNVGNCHGLIYGERDKYGDAGIVVPIMSISKIADAIVKLAQDSELRKEMGEAGYQRVTNCYTNDNFLEKYHKLYNELGKVEIKLENRKRRIKWLA